MSNGSRPHLLVLNQYYAPGAEATARLLAELCEALTDTFDVTVITGRLLGHPDEPDYELRNGVEVIRVHSTAFDRANILQRGVNYFTYLGRATRQGVKARQPDIVLCMTDPPMVGDIAFVIARRFRVPFVVVSQDIFPEIAVHLRRLRNPLLVRILDLLVRFALTRADHVVAIGETMRRRLEAKGVKPQRLEVISNWVDTAAIEPQPRDNSWARSNGLDNTFVVMHSGNIGYAQDLETLIRAAKQLDEQERLSVVLVGFGARLAEHRRLVSRLGAQRVRFLDHQPRELLPLSLSSADVHFVGLARGPFRLRRSESPLRHSRSGAARARRSRRGQRAGGARPRGWLRGRRTAGPARPRRGDDPRDARTASTTLRGMGERGRAWVEANADRQLAIGRYRELLARLLGSRAPS